MTPFSPPNTSQQPGGSTLLDRILQQAKRSFDSLTLAVTNERIVTQTIASGADVKVYHQLGQEPRTWEVVGINASSNVWESTTVNNKRDQYLLLRTSATATVAIRFT